jgi:hypothetical protein
MVDILKRAMKVLDAIRNFLSEVKYNALLDKPFAGLLATEPYVERVQDRTGVGYIIKILIRSGVSCMVGAHPRRVSTIQL